MFSLIKNYNFYYFLFLKKGYVVLRVGLRIFNESLLLIKNNQDKSVAM